MSENEFQPVVAPEDAWDFEQGQRSNGDQPRTALPARPAAAMGVPTVPAVAQVAVPGVVPPAAVVPAAPTAPPNAETGFGYVPPTEPVDATAAAIARLEQKLTAPAPAAQAAPEVDPVQAILNDPEASDEAKLLALRTLAAEQRVAKLEQQFKSREEQDFDARAAAAQQQIDNDWKVLSTVIRLTPQEAKQIEDAWGVEAQRDGRLVALTAEEAARRYFGPQEYEARRIGVAVRPVTPPNVVVPNTPTPAGFPTGHLVSDASNGGANGNRGGYTPPTRDKGPQLEDARRAAHAGLNS